MKTKASLLQTWQLSSKLICKFSKIPIKIPIGLFKELDKLILKVIQKPKG